MITIVYCLFVVTSYITLVPKPKCNQEWQQEEVLLYPSHLLTKRGDRGLSATKCAQPPMGGMIKKSCFAYLRFSRDVPGLFTTHCKEEMDTYKHMKAAILKRLCPDTEEDRVVARKRLSKRCLHEGESVDELAHDIEKLLDQASPGLPNEVKDMQLRFHLINSLPERVSLQLKVQPKVDMQKQSPRPKNFD